MIINLKPYIYNNELSKHYYICSQCKSKAMEQETGGEDSFYYLCMDCGSVECNPDWEIIKEPIKEENASEAWLSTVDMMNIILSNVIHN